MKRKWKWIIILLLLGIGLASLMGCQDSDDEAPAAESVTDQEIPVRVTKAEETTLPQIISYSGTIEPWEITHITGQTGQRIRRIFVSEGEEVQRGQRIAEMDSSSLDQAEVELRSARNEMQRMERLVEIGAVARQQLEQAQARYETAQSNAEMLRDNTHLSSPIDGVVTDKYFIEGEQFAPGAQTPAIVTIQKIDPLKVVIQVSERYFPVVRPDMPATVQLDTYGEQIFEGVVHRVNPTIDSTSRTFRVEIRVENSAGLMSPGMFAEVELELESVTGQFLPRAAIQTPPGRDQSYVFLVEDGTAHRTDITVGERFEQYQRIIEGLTEEDLVVVEGMSRLSEGTDVRIVEESE